MTDSALTLDPASLAVLVQKALIDSITPEARDKLLTDAIASLLAAPIDNRPHYERSKPLPSPLTEAFERAVRVVANDVVREAIENDPKAREAVRAVVHPLVADLCDGNYEGLPEKIGDAFGAWLQDQRR